MARAGGMSGARAQGRSDVACAAQSLCWLGPAWPPASCPAARAETAAGWDLAGSRAELKVTQKVPKY